MVNVLHFGTSVLTKYRTVGTKTLKMVNVLHFRTPDVTKYRTVGRFHGPPHAILLLSSRERERNWVFVCAAHNYCKSSRISISCIAVDSHGLEDSRRDRDLRFPCDSHHPFEYGKLRRAFINHGSGCLSGLSAFVRSEKTAFNIASRAGECLCNSTDTDRGCSHSNSSTCEVKQVSFAEMEYGFLNNLFLFFLSHLKTDNPLRHLKTDNPHRHLKTD